MTMMSEIAGDLVYTVHVPPVAAGTAIEVPIVKLPARAQVTGITWVPGAAVTADGANYATLSVRNRTTGAGTVVMATRAYSATNSVATTPEALTLSSAATDLQPDEGDLLTAAIAHSGTGLAIPAGLVQVAVRNR